MSMGNKSRTRLWLAFSTCFFLIFQYDLSALSLDAEIRRMESSRTIDGINQYATLLLIAEKYTEAAESFRALNRLTGEAQYLFNAALSLSTGRIAGDLDIWREYFKIPLKNRDGQRWDDLATLVMNSSALGSFDNPEILIKSVRNLYLGGGLYTALCLIRMHRSLQSKAAIGSSILADFSLREAEIMYRFGFHQDSLTLFRDHFKQTGDENCVVMMARCAYKMDDCALAEQYISFVKNTALKNFSFFVLWTRVLECLGRPVEAKEKMSMAGKLARTDREKKIAGQ